MARDYEDFSSIDDLDDISVVVDQGTVRLEGRVGTEAELRMADHVLTDVVGVVDYDNSLVVDATRRVETPLAIDDHLEAERQSAGSLFGEMPEQDEPTVVEARGDENLDQRMFGTTNYQDAVAHGVPYEPPESPTQEGIAGTDAGPGEYGEDH